MSSQNLHSEFSLPAAGAIGLYLRVKSDASGNAVLAGATDISVGTVQAQDLGNTVSIKGYNGGTRWFVASGAITAGVLVYGDAAGQVSATQATGAEICGYAREAASNAGDILEVVVTK